MMKLQSEVSTPLYQQLYDDIHQKIKDGIYQPGEKIPSEDKLKEIYGVSRITVRGAITKLCEDNLLQKKHGKGTYVAEKVHVECMSSGGSFTESCNMMGAKPSTVIVSITIDKVRKKISKKMDLKSDSKVIIIKRVRSVNNVPTIYEFDYFPTNYDFLLNNSLENQSIIKLIETNLNISINRFDDQFDIKFADKDQANKLQCEVGKPLLRVEQLIYSTNGEIVYLNEQFINSSNYKYAVRTVK